MRAREIESIVKAFAERKERVGPALDRDKIFQDLTEIAAEYEVIDWTDVESRCLEYKILLHKNQHLLDDDKELIKKLGGIRNDLRVFISIIDSYYYMFVDETKYVEARNKWEFRVKRDYGEEIRQLMKRVGRYLEHMGYKGLSERDVKTRVSGVETEYKESGKVNVFDCLFTDLEMIE